MAHVRSKARILESSITSGNGPYALGGAVDGSYKTFASMMAIGDITFATVAEPGVAHWTGLVTYSGTNEITLTTVEETSGTFGAGTKEIFTGYPASKSMFPEDIAGAIVTGGSSTAYTVASYRVYDTLTRLDGNIIAFSPHATNGATVTLNVDGLGDKPVRTSPGVELQSNSLIQGTPYLVLYNHADGVFYLHGMGANTYGVPLAAGMDYWAATTPSSAFAFPTGQQISQTTYAKLYALFGPNKYGADSGGLFFLPDKTGCVSVMQEASATRLTSAFFGGNSTVLGARGGGEKVTMASGNLIAHTHANTLSDPGHAHSSFANSGDAANAGLTFESGGVGYGTAGSTSAATTGISINNASAGSSSPTPMRTVQPTIVCNYILRVL
jgi:microcystin-dependent protein